MEVTLPADLKKQVEHLVDERQRGQGRLDALRRIGHAVDQAGLYERVLVPDQK